MKNINAVKKDHIFLILYIESMNFDEQFTAGAPVNSREKKNFSDSFYKVYDGSSVSDKKLICPFSDCLKQMKQIGNLKIHLRSHTGERPCVCDFPGC